jgi:HlyD family secretion protein
LTHRISLPFLSSGEEQRPSHLVVEKVRTAPFLVSVTVQGTLDSQKNGTVTNQVEGTTTIINIVPEGTKVKKGDVVCELDASAIDEKLRQQSITLTTAESAMTTAEENLRIQENQNDSDIAAALLANELAKLDLEKYTKGEYVQLLKAASGKVEIAKEAEVQADEGFKYSKRQVEKGTSQQNIAEAARIKHDQAKFDLEAASMELEVLEKFTKRRTESELEAKAIEAERNLKRVQISAEAKKAQCEKEMTAKRLSLAVEKEKFERYSRQKEACTLKAPQDGEVVYANLSSSDGRSSRSSSSGPAIETGATVYERQAIINLPDVTLMKVSCRVHESLIGQVRKGLAARVRVDAYSQEPFAGQVSIVSSVPMTGRWPNSDLREYDTQIYLTDDVERIRKLRPGLTAGVEILVDNREAVRQVPMQGVVAVADRHVAFVMAKNNKVEAREIQIGQTNQSHVEIIKGLEDGEQVVLNPRTYFAAEIAAIETKRESEKPKALLAATDAAAAKIAAGAVAPAGGPPGAAAPGAGGPAGGPGGGTRGNRDPGEAFKSMDADSSGSLTAEELPAPLQTNFAAMDTNMDGKLSLEEYTAGRAKFRRGPGGGGPGGGGPGGGGPGGPGGAPGGGGASRGPAAPST